MTVRQVLPICLTAVIAFTLGRILPRGSDGFHTSGNRPSEAATVQAAGGIREHLDGNPTAASMRHRERPIAKEKGSAEEMVKVPKSAVKSVLAGKHFLFMDMQTASTAIDSALALLGATENQRQQAAKLMEDTRGRLLQEEVRHFKIASAEPSKVLIDMGGISEAASKVIDGTKAGFREILQPDQAEALLDNLDWRCYYPQIESRSNQASFVIERAPDGSLTATYHYEGGSQGLGVDDGAYPDNGTPIPAAEVFGERWRPLLKGIELLPVDRSR